MADMLVKLYALPDLAPALAELRGRGVEVRRADPTEKRVVAGWVRRHFNESWAVGCEATIEQRPVTCFIALERALADAAGLSPYDLPAQKLLGFACYDGAIRGMFGPEGVRADRRGRGIGRALLLACLHAMAAERYAYAVIGWAGPTEFYAKTVGAAVIAGSEPGIFRGPLKGDD